MRRFVPAALALFLLASGSGALAAQVRVQGEAAPLSADNPRARRAIELVAPLLRGDTAAAAAYLREHGAPADGEDRGSMPLAAVAARFAGGGYTIHEVLSGIDDMVLVEVRRGDEVQGVMLRIEPASPHRVVGFVNGRVRIQNGGGAPRRPRS
jgi:hypothetical protein